MGMVWVFVVGFVWEPCNCLLECSGDLSVSSGGFCLGLICLFLSCGFRKART